MADEKKFPVDQPCRDTNEKARQVPLSEQHRQKDGWNDPTGWDRPNPTPVPPTKDD